MRLDLNFSGLQTISIVKKYCVFFLGLDSERDPPVPIPNTVVKPFCADGTARATVWESRSTPGFNFKPPRTLRRFFFGAPGSESQLNWGGFETRPYRSLRSRRFNSSFPEHWRRRFCPDPKNRKTMKNHSKQSFFETFSLTTFASIEYYPPSSFTRLFWAFSSFLTTHKTCRFRFYASRSLVRDKEGSF